MLESQADMTLVGQACNGREAIESFRRLRPDVTLMDLRMPDMSGIEAITAIRAEFPRSAHHRADHLRRRRAGGRGTQGGRVRLHAEEPGAQGIARDDPRRARAASGACRRRSRREIAEHVADDALTEREIEVLRRVAAGKSNKLIAVELDISEGTVKTHMKSILPKLDASDRTHAVMIALKRGILDL